MTNTWLVTGANGQLGQEFLRYPKLPNIDFMGLTKNELDITNYESVKKVMVELNPTGVINTAAWTNVDAAETSEAEAFSVNASGPEILSKVANEENIKLIHFSTDYVFNGKGNKPYEIDSVKDPQTAYGRTKLAGEIAIMNNMKQDFWILRTAWLYGEYGPNFVKTILKLDKTHPKLKVVNDQVGQPTWTFDVVEKVIEVIKKSPAPGIYHCVNTGQSSWHEFASEIFTQLSLDASRIQPVSTSEFPRPALRPAYSVLSQNQWKVQSILPMRNWREALGVALPLVKSKSEMEN